MITKFRNCDLQDHNQQETSYYCALNYCELKNRLICQTCLTQNLHHHDREDQAHILKQGDFPKFIGQQFQCIMEKLQQNSKLVHIQGCINQLDEYIQSANALLILLKKQGELLINQNNIEYLGKIHNLNQYSLDNELVNNIIEIIYNFNNKTQDDLFQDDRFQNELLNKLKNQQKEIDLQIELFEQENKQYQDQQLKDQSHLRYYSKYVDYYSYEQEDSILAAAISLNEKYLVISDENKLGKILDLETKTVKQSINYIDNVYVSKFSTDYLLCGDIEGQLYCYDHNFTEIYRRKIHQTKILDILQIDQDLILTSAEDYLVMITSIQQDNQQLIIKEFKFDRYVSCLEYDREKSIIICAQENSKISFFDKNGIIIFQQSYCIDNESIKQVQLVQNNKNLLCSSQFEIRLLFINYENKSLDFLRYINQEHIYFSSVNDDSRIIICEDQIQILDSDFNLEQKIKHKIKGNYLLRNIRQLNSANYILAMGRYEVQLLKRM